MNWSDYTILTVLGLSSVVGLWRGLISEVLALLIWGGAAWLAWLLGPTVAAYFEHAIPQASVRLLVGYGACFLLVLVLGALLRYVIGQLVAGTGLGGMDRLLGMIFGAARGVLLVALAVFLLGFTVFTHDAWWRESLLLPHFQRIAVWLGQHVPASVQPYLKSGAAGALAPLPSLRPPGSASSTDGALPAPAHSAP